MPGSRCLSVARSLTAAVLLLLCLVPAGLRGWRAMPSCQCGMARAQCACPLHHAKAGHHPSCGMAEGMPDRCSLRSSHPLEGQSASMEPDFRDRLGVVRQGAPEVSPEPGETLVSLNVLPPAAQPSPPEVPPPRAAFRIG